jgi:sugar phosphate isomerase/epimerase
MSPEFRSINLRRRRFLAQSAKFAALLGTAVASATPQRIHHWVTRDSGVRVKIALNAYSFDEQLRKGTMTLEGLIDFCAEQGLDALDATGYYFATYPRVPTDETIYRLKRKAYLNGVAISFTGVKNDFTLPSVTARQKEVQLVKDWIVVASKLGAPMIRVFTGPAQPHAYTFEQVVEWMIPNFRECADFAKTQGVIIGLQNHEDFIRTADQVIRIVKEVNSEWFASILDIGSLRKYDVYQEIEKLLPYAASWLIKENVWYGEKPVPVDLHRIKVIIDRQGYRGYLPILTLGEGDPAGKVIKMARDIRTVFAAECG